MERGGIESSEERDILDNPRTPVLPKNTLATAV
jgi:hypothetical protein